jgi:acylphosphatase
MSDSPSETKQLRLHGRVQGVYFRESMCRKAAELGITGWVRNRRDGTLEALVQGAPEAVAGILAWARTGPPAAQVTRMETSEGSGHYSEFMRMESV